MRNEFRLRADPYFDDVYCPKHHHKEMTELNNGVFGNPLWWCRDCDYPYELKLTKMQKFDRDEVQRQLAEINAKTSMNGYQDWGKNPPTTKLEDLEF